MIKFRNANGYSIYGKLPALAWGRTELRPCLGTLRQSPGIQAYVSKVDHGGLTAAAAEELSKLACQPVGIPHGTTLNARSSGQDRQFFKAVVNRLFPNLGLGRGSAPHVMASFESPDKPESIKLIGDKSRLHNALPWVFRAHAAELAAKEKSVKDKFDRLKVNSLVAYRDAKDLEPALVNKRNQYVGVCSKLERGIAEYESKLDTLRLEKLELSKKYDKAQLEVQRLEAKLPKSKNPISNSRPSYKTELGPKGQIKMVRDSARESSWRTHFRDPVTRPVNKGELQALDDELQKAKSARLSIKIKIDSTDLAIEKIGGRQNSNDHVTEQTPPPPQAWSRRLLQRHQPQATPEVIARAERRIKLPPKLINSIDPKFNKGQIERLHDVLKDVKDVTPRDLEGQIGAAKDSKASEEKKIEALIEPLLISPPGFEAQKDTQRLQNLLTGLRDHLKSVPEGISDKDKIALLLKRPPLHSVLEIVSRYLAEVTKGDADKAASTLENLMGRSFASLVPPPGHNFIHQRVWRGNGADDSGSIEKRFISLVADTPGGVELLKRLVKSGPQVTDAVHDAVIVYYRASRALAMPPPDTLSLERLREAEQAAKILARSGNDDELTRTQKINFNAVRNQHTSFGPGSSYAVIEAALEKYGKWMSRAEKGEAKRTPLQATQRRFGTKVTADLDFPTYAKLLNERLLEACDEAQKIISCELLQARKQVLAERENQAVPKGVPAQGVPRVLMQALSMIAHIQACAERGQRLDTKRLGSIDWLRINRRAAIMAQSEVTHSSRTWQGMVTINPVNHPPGDSGNGDQQPLSFSGLKDVKLGMKRAPTVLEALVELKEVLLEVKPDQAAGLDPLLQGKGEAPKPEVILRTFQRGLDKWQEMLIDAQDKQKKIDQFLAKKGEFLADSLEGWVSPAFLKGYESLGPETSAPEISKTTDPVFGNITLRHGHQWGFSARALLSGFAGAFTGGVGWVARPEIEGIRSANDQIRFSRETTGMSISMGRVNEHSLTLGGSAAFPFFPGKMPAIGPSASLLHMWSKSSSKGVAVIRVPQFRKKESHEISNDIREIIKTLAAYNPKSIGDKGRHESLVDTLLADFPSISITSVENDETHTHRAIGRFGVFCGLIYPQPVGKSALFWSASLGVEGSSLKERRNYKTTGGAQGYLINTQSAKHEAGVAATTPFRHGFVQDQESKGSGPRGDIASLSANFSLRASSALSGCIQGNQPDGTMVGERFVEYSNYEKFEKAVNNHRERWIEAGIKLGDRDRQWPEEFDETDKRLQVERALIDFMESARESLASGTVILHENLDIKPEVAAQLSANIALEQLYRRQERDEDALALQAERQYILSHESSYQPFQLKVIASSKISRALEWSVGLVAGVTHEASAKKVYDYFPRFNSVPPDVT